MEAEGTETLMAKPNPKAPLGQGGRFAAIEAKARAGGARNPAAVATAVGRKKYGKKRMAQMAAKGRAAARRGSGVFSAADIGRGYRVI